MSALLPNTVPRPASLRLQRQKRSAPPMFDSATVCALLDPRFFQKKPPVLELARPNAEALRRALEVPWPRASSLSAAILTHPYSQNQNLPKARQMERAISLLLGAV